MRILIHGINFSPELTGIGKYTGELAAWLAARGHSVRVVAAPPYYPQWQLADGYKNIWRKEEVETPEGRLTVFRCPVWVPAKPTGLTRLLHLMSFALSSFPVILRQVLWRPDVVWVVEPPLFCAPAAWLTARLCGAKAWLHVQDFEVDAAFALGLLPSRWLRRVATAAEGWLMRRFDQVSTISGNMLKCLAVKGVTDGVLFPNWVDPAELCAEGSDSNLFRSELDISNNAVVALYSGNMGKKQGLEVLAEAARLFQETRTKGAFAPHAGSHSAPEVVFVFCGNGAGRADLVARCAGLSNVRFLDLQPIERLGALLGMADLHLLPQRADAADLVMPSKLTGMFASGRPVVATALPDTQVAEVVAGRGLIVPPGDGAALAAAVGQLAGDPAERECLGRAARDYAVANWSRDNVIAEFERVLIGKVRVNGV